MKLEHFAINVPEPAAIAQWFADHLGMRIVMAQDVSPYMHFVADDDGSMIELYNNPSAADAGLRRNEPLQLSHCLLVYQHRRGQRKADRSRGNSHRRDHLQRYRRKVPAFFRNPWQIPVQFVQRPKALI